MNSFHDVQFPLALSRGAKLTVQTASEVVELSSGREVRNARWAEPRRRWTIAGAISSEARVKELITFFEARRGNVHAFRFRDALNYSSGGDAPSPLDQIVGVGDGETQNFQLAKDGKAITKPVAGSVRIAIEGAETSAFSVDLLSGVITFDDPPVSGADIRAGFLFDVPVRFESVSLDIAFDAYRAGRAPNLSIIEVRA